VHTHTHLSARAFDLTSREEVMTLQSLRHPNVLQFLGVCSKPPNLCMVTEHMPFSLHSVLYTTKAQVSCLVLYLANRASQHPLSATFSTLCQ